MARISLLAIFIVWLYWQPSAPQYFEPPRAVDLLLLCLAPLAVILIASIYSRWIAARIVGASFGRYIERFHRVVRIVTLVLPLWFAAAVYLAGWPLVVMALLWPLHAAQLESARFAVGTLPPLLCWVLLWLVAHPAESAFREQELALSFADGAVLHTPPTRWQYVLNNVRQQLLFGYIPILCILILHDLFSAAAPLAHLPRSAAVGMGISILSMLPILIFAPVLLVRVLPTEKLRDPELRQRLESLCAHYGIRTNAILLWRTHGQIGNAAVMGILPHLRYLLVTDRLLETLSQEQVVAVFAHELGHVVYRHLIWMGGITICLLFVAAGPGDTLWGYLSPYITWGGPYADLAGLAVTGCLFLLILSALIRRMERQADVTAARNLPELCDGVKTAGPTHVQARGAQVFSQALCRIAAINGLSLRSFDWFHGSLAGRMDYLMKIADQPEQTYAFDRSMRRMYWIIAAVFVISAGWTVFNAINEP